MSNEPEYTLVEINGVKMEVDLRSARVVHNNLKIGSAVKLLLKSTYGEPKVCQGVIVAFDAFPELPTITVAYVKTDYTGAELHFAHVNAKTTESFSMVPCVDDQLPIDRTDMIQSFGRKIEAKQQEIRDLEAKREYFLKHFDQFFVTEQSDATFG